MDEGDDVEAGNVFVGADEADDVDAGNDVGFDNKKRVGGEADGSCGRDNDGAGESTDFARGEFKIGFFGSSFSHPPRGRVVKSCKLLCKSDL